MTTTNGRDDKSKSACGPKTREEIRAAAEDVKVQAILREARERKMDSPMVTEESIRAREEHLRQGGLIGIRTLHARIARKELLSKDEFRELLGVTDEWIDVALSENRLFACIGASGEPYFPSFFADKWVPLNAFEVVSQALRNLPGDSKFHFFKSKSTFLRKKTPLESMRNGELKKVVIAAEGFAER